VRKLVAMAMLLLGAVFVLAACGGDDPTPTPKPRAAATPTPQAAPLPAWEVEWNETLAAAKSEGQVDVWVGGGGNAAREFLEGAFEKAYPSINVELFQAAKSSARDTRYVQEWEAGVASLDLFNGGSSGGDGRLKPMGALQPIKPFFLLPEVLDEDLWTGGHLYVDIEGQYMMMAGGNSIPALAVSADVDPASITKWEDLLKPEFKGKIVMNDPRTSGNGAARAGFWFCAPDPRCFEPTMRDFMKRLFTETDIVLSDDDRVNLDQINSGKMKVLISPSTDELPALHEIGKVPTLIRGLNGPDGSRVDQISDSPGILYVPNIDIPHPNATKVYINWFYSKAGQQELVNIRSTVSRRTDVDLSALPDYLIPEPPVYSVNQTIRMLNPEGGIRESVAAWAK